jgi:hypothetical protein
MLVNLTAVLLVVLLNTHFLVHSAEIVLNESGLRTNENDIRTTVSELFASPTNQYIRARFPESLALQVPPKMSHPSISLQGISPNLFMELIAGTTTLVMVVITVQQLLHTFVL